MQKEIFYHENILIYSILTLLHVHAIHHSKMLSYMWVEQAFDFEMSIAFEAIVDTLPYPIHISGIFLLWCAVLTEETHVTGPMHGHKQSSTLNAVVD